MIYLTILNYEKKQINPRTIRLSLQMDKKQQFSGIRDLCLDKSITFRSRLPDNINICDAELGAIYICLLLSLNKVCWNILVLSDSKTVIDRLKNSEISNQSDEILLKIKDLKQKRKKSNTNWLK